MFIMMMPSIHEMPGTVIGIWISYSSVPEFLLVVCNLGGVMVGHLGFGRVTWWGRTGGASG